MYKLMLCLLVLVLFACSDSENNATPSNTNNESFSVKDNYLISNYLGNNLLVIDKNNATIVKTINNVRGIEELVLKQQEADGKQLVDLTKNVYITDSAVMLLDEEDLETPITLQLLNAQNSVCGVSVNHRNSLESLVIQAAEATNCADLSTYVYKTIRVGSPNIVVNGRIEPIIIEDEVAGWLSEGPSTISFFSRDFSQETTSNITVGNNLFVRRSYLPGVRHALFSIDFSSYHLFDLENGTFVSPNVTTGSTQLDINSQYLVYYDSTAQMLKKYNLATGTVDNLVLNLVSIHTVAMSTDGLYYTELSNAGETLWKINMNFLDSGPHPVQLDNIQEIDVALSLSASYRFGSFGYSKFSTNSMEMHRGGNILNFGTVYAVYIADSFSGFKFAHGEINPMKSNITDVYSMGPNFESILLGSFPSSSLYNNDAYNSYDGSFLIGKAVNELDYKDFTELYMGNMNTPGSLKKVQGLPQ